MRETTLAAAGLLGATSAKMAMKTSSRAGAAGEGEAGWELLRGISVDVSLYVESAQSAALHTGKPVVGTAISPDCRRLQPRITTWVVYACSTKLSDAHPHARRTSVSTAAERGGKDGDDQLKAFVYVKQAAPTLYSVPPHGRHTLARNQLTR